MTQWTSPVLSGNLHPSVAALGMCHSSLLGVTCGSLAISEILIVVVSCFRLSGSDSVPESTPLARNLLVQQAMGPADKAGKARPGPPGWPPSRSLGEAEPSSCDCWPLSCSCAIQMELARFGGVCGRLFLESCELTKASKAFVLILTLPTYGGVIMEREIK